MRSCALGRWWPAKSAPASGSACCCLTWRQRWRWCSAWRLGAGGGDAQLHRRRSIGMRCPPAPPRSRTIVGSPGPVQAGQELGGKWPRCGACRLGIWKTSRAGAGAVSTLWLLLWARPFPRAALCRPRRRKTRRWCCLFSGSEGKPKRASCCPHPGRCCWQTWRRSACGGRFSIDGKILNALPLFHSFGPSPPGLLPLLTGAGSSCIRSPLHYR